MMSFQELVQRMPLAVVIREGKNLVYANDEAKKIGIDSIDLDNKDKVIIGKNIYKLISTKFKNYNLFIAFEYSEEQKIIDALNVYERFFKSGKDFFFILDEKGKFLDVNQTYEVVGYHREELLGKTTKIIAFEDQIDVLRENFKKVLNGESVRFIFKARTAKGETKFIEVLEWPRVVEGKIIGGEGVARDITERYVLQQQLEKMNRALKILTQVNQQIFKEKDEYALLQRIWSILKSYGIRSYIWLNKQGKLVDAIPNASQCPAFKDPKLRYEMCNCDKSKEKSLIIPLTHEDRFLGLLALCSIGELDENEMRVFLQLGGDIGLGIDHYNADLERRIMSNIISENLKHFENLADKLRNPIAIALGYLEIINEVGTDKVLKEIKNQLNRMMETIEELRRQETITFLITKRK
ncbi:MAG: PAS domain S-box protein [Archaeoglobaceae archaeon]|nr:PAS domain S-box protein [Archaeoglobaceae archaeon]MDW8117433.1 PAS domain S-box protein [Archaeoglobaceae archaeon]